MQTEHGETPLPREASVRFRGDFHTLSHGIPNIIEVSDIDDDGLPFAKWRQPVTTLAEEQLCITEYEFNFD
jgi:hypothetical protein